MRHLWSMLVGVVVAPLTWLLIAVGQGGSTDTIAEWVDDGRYDTSGLIEPAAYLAVAGLLLGLVGTLRVSPLGPLAAGALLVAPYAVMFINPFAVHDTLPANAELLGRRVPLHLPLDNGTLFLVGTLLMIAVCSAQRWRQWPEAAPAAARDGEEATEPEAARPGDAPLPRRADSGHAPGAEPAETPDAPEVAEPRPTTSTTIPRSPRSLTPLPRRPDTRSPWSTPPQTTGRREAEEAAGE